MHAAHTFLDHKYYDKHFLTDCEACNSASSSDEAADNDASWNFSSGDRTAITTFQFAQNDISLSKITASVFFV